MPLHPDRLIPLQGVSNFRDLGGYAGDGGRPLAQRRLRFTAENARLDRDSAETDAEGRAQLVEHTCACLRSQSHLHVSQLMPQKFDHVVARSHCQANLNRKFGRDPFRCCFQCD